MSTIKGMIIKCVTALLISTVMASSLVAFAAANPHSTVVIIDNEKKLELNTHRTTAEEILSDAKVELSVGDTAVLSNLEDGTSVLTVKRAFPVYVTVGNDTKMVKVTGGTVAEVLEKTNVTLSENSVCNLALDTELSKETYIDVVEIKYVTESYEETIPFTARVEYSSSLEKGKQKVTGGVNGTKTVTVKKTYKNGVITDTETVSTTVTKPAVEKVTVIGTKVAPKKVSSNQKAYSEIKTISTLKAPESLTLTESGIPTSYKKVVTVQATAYTDHSGIPCSTGVMPQTGYIAVNPKVIPYGTKMFIVSKDGKYVYGYAIAADTGGFIKRRPTNVDLFFDTESQCKTFGRRDVVIYFL